MANYDWDFTDYELEAKKNAAADKVIAEFRGMGWDIDVRVYHDGGWTASPAGPLTCRYCGCMVKAIYSQTHRQRCQPIVG